MDPTRLEYCIEHESIELNVAFTDNNPRLCQFGYITDAEMMCVFVWVDIIEVENE